MTTGDLRLRVTLASAPAIAALGAGGFWVAGAPAALGVVAGAGLGLGHFWWLARSAAGIVGGVGRPALAWRALAAIRLLAAWVVLVGLFTSGLVHPVAVVIGFVIVPVALVAEGLRGAARSEEAR